MKCYRTQPQSASHIYRSVLITPRNPSQGILNINFVVLFYKLMNTIIIIEIMRKLSISNYIPKSIKYQILQVNEFSFCC